MGTATKERRRRGKTTPASDAPRKGIRALQAWKLEDAKARFSEVVRLARSKGPQRVTYRGEDAVVVISIEAYQKLLARRRPKTSLVEFLRDTALDQIKVEREADRGREPVL
jgi:prevent-host-death family protein